VISVWGYPGLVLGLYPKVFLWVVCLIAFFIEGAFKVYFLQIVVVYFGVIEN